MEEVVFTDHGGDICAITLNRPDKRNALTMAMRREIIRLLRSDAVLSARALLLFSTGEIFSAGADLKDPAAMDPRNVSVVSDLMLEIRQCHPIVISAIQGPAIGLGAGIALAADMVLVAPEASFSYPEIRHGLVATMTSVSLIDLMAPRKAFEMLLLGERMNAEDAMQQGLINRIVPADRLQDAAMELARRIAALNPEAVSSAKRFFYEVKEMPYTVGMRSAERVSELMRVYKRAEAAEANS